MRDEPAKDLDKLKGHLRDVLLDANESGQVLDILAQQSGRKTMKWGLVDTGLLFRVSVLSACAHEKSFLLHGLSRRTCNCDPHVLHIGP